MPPAVAAASVAAAAQLGGSVLASRANNRSTDAQARATRDAMAYQREQEWRARSETRRQYDQYMRSVYGDRYQPNPARSPVAGPVAAPAGPVVAPGATPAPGAQPPIVAPVAAPGAVPAAPPVAAQAVQPRTMADLGPWSANNYGQYLGRR
jgi:hypothetical protein